MLKLPDESFLEIFGIWKHHLRVVPNRFQFVDAQQGMANLSVNFDLDPSHYVWLRCDKHRMGKTLVRKGKRVDLPETDEKEPKWVFCPMKEEAMRKGLIPYNRDRVSTSECEKCQYFKGYQEPHVPSAPSTEKNKRRRLPIFRVTKEMIEQAFRMAIEDDEEWRSSEEGNSR